MKPKISAQENRRMWGIRAGIRGSAHSWFIQHNVVGLSDPGMGDLRKISPDRNSFYTAYRRLRPGETKLGIAGIGGKFYRFTHEINIGDLVVYPSSIENWVYVGRVVGEYRYLTKQIKNLPHQRNVKWLCNFGKVQLSKTAQRELGSARTFFEVKRHSLEISRLVRQVSRSGREAKVSKE